jgi:hypothetical protein
MKTVILNFANDRGNYRKMQTRLYDSLQSVGYYGDVWLFEDEKSIREDCPLHDQVPYAFKAYAIQKAIDEGYENIIWMDSAVYAVKPIDNFINQIEKEGYIFFDNIGYTIGDYTSDMCLTVFGWTRQKAFNHKMIMACCFGINVYSKKAMSFFKGYFQAAKEKLSFQGAWTNDDLLISEDMRVRGHRHDQSVASILIQDLGMGIVKGQDTYFAYFNHKEVMRIADSVCLLSQGI